MGLLDKLFGGEKGNKEKQADNGDPNGIYFDVTCGKCEQALKIRADRQNDLGQREGGGYIWRKTITCDSCFQRMNAEVIFDNKHTVQNSDIDKGKIAPA